MTHRNPLSVYIEHLRPSCFRERDNSWVSQSTFGRNCIEAFLDFVGLTDADDPILFLDFGRDDAGNGKKAKALATEHLDEGAIFKLAGEARVNVVSIEP